MKQVLQNARSGEVSVVEVPAPSVQRGRVLVRTAASLISAGTEKTAIDSGKKGLLARARERPDLVKQVIEKAVSEGIARTVSTVRAKLDSGTALGYSAAGTVIAVGEGVSGFRVGDRVACAGAGYASHAEVISTPQNLCVHLPENVDFDQGAFATLGAIALQGVRLAAPTLGEAVVVIGLGLLGHLTVQLLRANGCRVFGVDIDDAKFAVALGTGADLCATPDNAAQAIREWSRGRGADAVLITAGSSSNGPVELAGEVSRLKGRVVAVGLIGLDVPRNLYFKKELSLQVSMSYGPGRYDPEYEERGNDYPFAYVRWTEQRNLEAFLDCVAIRSVDVDKLVTHRFPIARAEDAYKLISGEKKDQYLGILLEYDTNASISTRVPVAAKRAAIASVRIGVIGAGGYARGMLLPQFQKQGVEFSRIMTASGLTARDVAKQYGFNECVSDAREVIEEDATDLIVVATRHDTHAALAIAALEAQKHVFVEKPLALNDDELDRVLEAASASRGRLMVGFNRRFSPAARQAREFFPDRNFPLSIVYRVNAGRIPSTSWIQDPIEGGGRIVGEVCHFVDLIHFLTGSLTTRVYAEAVTASSSEVTCEDSVIITLKLADGSNGAIAYLAEGDRSLAKERVEIFGGGRSFVIDDFRTVTGYLNGKETARHTGSQDKGQAEQIRVVCQTVRDGTGNPIVLEDLERTTRVTFRVLDSLRSGVPVSF